MTRPEAAVRQQSSTELLAVRHYEQVYGFFSAFHDNPALCLELTDRSFRDAEAIGLSTVAVFGQAVARLNCRPGLTLPLETASLESNVVWILKEVAGLSYAEICHATGLSRTEVMESVAVVRHSVLSQLAA
jgi:hypothetical protein